jgi:hypothetical protein
VILQQTAEGSSQCPVTGETIRLTITPEGVTSKHPESAAISMSGSRMVLPSFRPLRTGLEDFSFIRLKPF